MIKNAMNMDGPPRQKEILDLLAHARCGLAVGHCRQWGVSPARSDLEDLVRRLTRHRDAAAARGQTGEARRLGRHIHAVSAFADFGPAPEKMIAEMELPPGYDGKIMLVGVSGDLLEAVVCLRSGDDWHREILRNAIQELLDLGFQDTHVYPLGGAYVRFEAGVISIWGTSDDFGTCDKNLAREIILRGYPDKIVEME